MGQLLWRAVNAFLHCFYNVFRYFSAMSQPYGEFDSDADAADPAQFWSRKAAQVRWLVNSAWWLEAFLPAAFGAAVALSVVVLMGRRAGWSQGVFVSAAALAAMAALGASYLRARRHFISLTQARAQIDGALSMHTRLTAAAEGVGNWPDPALWRGGNWRWNFRRLALAPATSTALVAAAFLIPMARTAPALPPPTAKPPALAQVEELLQKLEDTPSLDPTSLDPVRQQEEQLARQQAGDWYSQSSLEAADHLVEQLQAGVRAMDENATKIQSVLSAAAEAELSDSQAGALSQTLSSALSALQGNIPGLNKNLAAALQQIDPSKLRTLSPEQVEDLKKQLGECKGACQKCQGQGPDKDVEEASRDEDGQGQASGKKGGGPRPLRLNHKAADVDEQTQKPLTEQDFSHAALGEQIGQSSGQHDVDRQTDHRAADGGSAAAQGAGPGAVWIQQNLTPQERRQVQEFFDAAKK